MANIGIAISGRKPGFQNFVLIGWNGTPPEDVSYMGRSAGEVYYTAALGNEFSVYERVLCRFNPGDGRTNVFKYSIQVPSGALIMNGSGQPVSPKFILDAIAATVEGDVIVREGAMWRFRIGTGRPEFPTARMTQITAEYSLMPMWGGSAVMQGLNSPYFVECSDADIPNLLMHIPQLPDDRLAVVSQLVFGHFNGSDRAFVFTKEDMEAIPKVTLRVQSDKRNFDMDITGASVDIKTADLGYPPEYYKEEMFKLDYTAVLRAYYSGEDLPSFPWLRFQLYGQQGVVVANVTPQPVDKTFSYHIEGVRTDLARDKILGALSYRSALGNYEAVTREFSVSGEKNRDFKNLADHGLADIYRLDRSCGYELAGIRLEGDRVVVKVREVPVPKAAKSKPATTATGERTTLRVILPASEKNLMHWVFVTMPGANHQETTTVMQGQFVIADGKKVFEHTFDYDIRGYVNVSVDSPTKYKAQALAQHDGSGVADLYVADMTDPKCRIGLIGRMRRLFSFSKSDYCSTGARVLRITAVILLFFFVFLAGGLLGGTLTNFVTKHVLPGTEEVTEPLEDQTTPEEETTGGATTPGTATTPGHHDQTPVTVPIGPAPSPAPDPAAGSAPEPEADAANVAPDAETPAAQSAPAPAPDGKISEPSGVSGSSNGLTREK